VQVDGGQRCSEPPTARRLKRPDVVDPTVPGEVERDRRGYILAAELCHEHVKWDRIHGMEEPARHAGETEMLRQLRRSELEVGPGQADVIEHHAHRARHLIEDVGAPLEIGSQLGVAFVHPGGKPGDAGSLEGGLHRGDRAGTRGCGEVALQESVVVDGALRIIGKHRGRHARKTPYRRALSAAGVLLPGGEQGVGAAEVQLGCQRRRHVRVLRSSSSQTRSRTRIPSTISPSG
jgi:hypothetical protein